MALMIEKLTENAIAVVEAGKINLFTNEFTVYNEKSFRNALSNCSGVNFIEYSVQDFTETVLIRFLRNAAYNSITSLNDIAYVVTCVANDFESRVHRVV